MEKAYSVPVFALSGIAVAFATLALTGCGSKAPAPIAPSPAVVGADGTNPYGTPPAAAPAAPAPEPFSLKEGEQLVPHKVMKGDTLWELAQKYQTRVSRIKSANNLQSDTIIEGRTVQIPTKMTGAPAVAAPAPAPAATPAPAAPAPKITAPPAPAVPQAAPTPPAAAPPSLNFGTPPAAPATGPTGGLRLQN